MNEPQPMSHLQALAAAYNLDPTLPRWNAFVEALNIPAERSSPYRNGRDRDPTANTAIGKADRERKSP